MNRIVGVVAAALLALPLSAAAADAAPSSCATAWGSDLETNYTVTSAGVTVPDGRGAGEAQGVRTGTDACWDRIVIDLAGPPGLVLYNVAYVDEVTREGSGDVVPVPGGATLQISMLNPVSAGFTAPGAVGGYPSLRSVVHAGDFEGLAVGIGVRARLPFRVLTLTGPNRIVVDIAHRWR